MDTLKLEIATIRKYLKAHIAGLSITQGKGTAARWIYISAPGGLKDWQQVKLKALLNLDYLPGDSYQISPETRKALMGWIS